MGRRRSERTMASSQGPVPNLQTGHSDPCSPSWKSQAPVLSSVFFSHRRTLSPRCASRDRMRPSGRTGSQILEPEVGSEVGLESFFCRQRLLFWPQRSPGCFGDKRSGRNSRRKPSQGKPGDQRRRLRLQAEGLGNLWRRDCSAAGIMGSPQLGKP